MTDKLIVVDIAQLEHSHFSTKDRITGAIARACANVSLNLTPFGFQGRRRCYSLKAFIELKYEGLVDPDDEGFAEYLSEVLKKVQHAEELFVDRHPNLEFRVSWTPMMRSTAF